MSEYKVEVDKEILRKISDRCVRRQKISWSWIENLSKTYDELFYYVRVIMGSDTEFQGFPSPRTEEKLKEAGIKI